MKKLFLFTLLVIAVIFISITCTKNTDEGKRPPKSNIPKIQIMKIGGELICSKRGAYDSVNVAVIEIYFLDNYFYCYREIVPRGENDSMGTWTNCEEAGEWQQIADEHMQLTMPDDGYPRIIVPFSPDEDVYQVASGGSTWNYCCECSNVHQCCMAWPSGRLGYTCMPCGSNRPCSTGCMAINTDDIIGMPGGPQFIFYHPQLTATNFIKCF